MTTGQQRDAADDASDAWSQLRRARPRAGWSLGEKERRDRYVEQSSPLASPRTALAIAEEQLAHVREVVGVQPGPPVIDLARLERCADARAVRLRRFTADIQWRRGDDLTGGGVVFVRQDDLDALSGLLGCRPDEVAPELERLDVLAT